MKAMKSAINVQVNKKHDGLSFEMPNSKPRKELLDDLEEGEKIIQEVREGKRQGYNNVNEMMRAILDD